MIETNTHRAFGIAAPAPIIEAHAVTIRNDAGERIATAKSDAEACRWFADNGRRGDYIDDADSTTLANLTRIIWPDATVTYDRDDCAHVTGLD